MNVEAYESKQTTHRLEIRTIVVVLFEYMMYVYQLMMTRTTNNLILKMDYFIYFYISKRYYYRIRDSILSIPTIYRNSSI